MKTITNIFNIIFLGMRELFVSLVKAVAFVVVCALFILFFPLIYPIMVIVHNWSGIKNYFSWDE
jgi:hypothetical protein